MDLTPAERAQYIVRYLAKKKGITQAQVGELIGYSNKSALSAVLSGKKQMPRKFGAKLAELDPEINLEFLDGNSNEPFRDGAQLPFPKESEKKAISRPAGLFIPAELIQLFTDQATTIRSQQETIRLLVDKLSK